MEVGVIVEETKVNVLYQGRPIQRALQVQLSQETPEARRASEII
jgi:hypothetical protein